MGRHGDIGIPRAKWRSLAREARADGTLQGWVSTFSDYLLDRPEDHDAWGTLAELHMESGDYASAFVICLRKLTNDTSSAVSRMTGLSTERAGLLLIQQELHMGDGFLTPALTEPVEPCDVRSYVLQHPADLAAWVRLSETHAVAEDLVQALWAAAVAIVNCAGKGGELVDMFSGTFQVLTCMAEGPSLWASLWGRGLMSFDVAEFLDLSKTERVDRMIAVCYETIGVRLPSGPIVPSLALLPPSPDWRRRRSLLLIPPTQSGGFSTHSPLSTIH